MKKISGLRIPNISIFSTQWDTKSDADSEYLESFKLGIFVATAT